jgi:hypothetical protein
VRFEANNMFFHFEKNGLVYYSAGVVVVNSGANPTTLGYNASSVKNFNATNIIARF